MQQETWLVETRATLQINRLDLLVAAHLTNACILQGGQIWTVNAKPK